MTDINNENKSATTVKVEEKITFVGNTETLAAKLDGIKAMFRCNLTGAKKPVAMALRHGDEIKDIPIRLECNGATVMQALKFACGGQSYRVAIQRRLRVMKADDLRKAVKNNAPLVFHLSDLVNPVRAPRVAMAPKDAANHAIDKMDDADKMELLKKLQAEMAVKNEG